MQVWGRRNFFGCAFNCSSQRPQVRARHLIHQAYPIGIKWRYIVLRRLQSAQGNNGNEQASAFALYRRSCLVGQRLTDSMPPIHKSVRSRLLPMKQLAIFCIAAAITVLPLRRMHAAFVLTLSQVGPNIVVTGSSTLNFSTLTLHGASAASPNIRPSNAAPYVGALSSSASYYDGAITGPSSFGGGDTATTADSGTGTLQGSR